MPPLNYPLSQYRVQSQILAKIYVRAIWLDVCNTHTALYACFQNANASCTCQESPYPAGITIHEALWRTSIANGLLLEWLDLNPVGPHFGSYFQAWITLITLLRNATESIRRGTIKSSRLAEHAQTPSEGRSKYIWKCRGNPLGLARTTQDLLLCLSELIEKVDKLIKPYLNLTRVTCSSRHF